jgi:hypothetical protein
MPDPGHISIRSASDGCFSPAVAMSAVRRDNSTALARDESRNDASGNVTTPASSIMSDLARYRSEASPDARASIASIYRIMNERGERDK